MNIFKISLTALACLALLATAGCDGNWCLGDDCSTECLPGDGGCYEDCRCWGDCGCNCGCRDDDWDDDWENEWCTSDADCPAGQVCHPNDVCVDVVKDCPLTDECLGDPEGYTPEWMGIDPLFVGSFSGPDGGGRTEMMIDFYDDHIYGEAQVVIVDADGWAIDWRWVVITGSRDGAELWGQIVEADAWERTFDAVFEATLLSASEMVGQVFVASDDGETTLDFHLYRTSPCGCEPDAGCELDADCPADQVCQDSACVDGCPTECCADGDCAQGEACVEGACQPVCQTECCADADCAESEACVEGACQPVCQTECCAHADCPLGFDCVEGECLNPCVHWCDCEEGEDCIDGYCRPAS